jgi:hypothetical protein
MIEEIKKYLFEQQKKNEELLKKIKKEDEKENQLLIGAIIATNKMIIDICDVMECYLFESQQKKKI